MKIFIVEDNTIYRTIIKEQLSTMNMPLEVVGEAHDLSTAKERIKQLKPDVLIMDIMLKGENSFSIFKEVDFSQHQIIFVTAHADFAIPAFDVQAIGYLVKPINRDQLEKNLKVAQQNLRSKQPPSQIEPTINIPSEEGFDIVKVKHIIRCEAVNAATYIFIEPNKKMVSSYNIGRFKELLAAHGFFQPHRSYLINPAHVKKYIRSGVIVMNDGSEIPLSQNHRQEFIALFSDKMQFN